MGVAHIFDSVEQAAKELTPNRCSHLSDIEISQKQNIWHIRRVVNKGVLTTTEKGQSAAKFEISSNAVQRLDGNWRR